MFRNLLREVCQASQGQPKSAKAANPMSSFFEKLSGESAILVGGGEGLAQFLGARFKRLVSADPHRSLSSPLRTRQLEEGEILYVSGQSASPDQMPQQVDLVVLAFLLAANDDPQRLIEPWVKLVKNRGKLVLIEWASHKLRGNGERNVHARVLDLLENEGAFHPPTSRDMIRWLQGNGLIHARQQTETADLLLNEQDCAFIAAEGISQLVSLGMGDSELVGELRSSALKPAPVTIAHATYKQIEDPATARARLDSKSSSSESLVAVTESLGELPEWEGNLLDLFSSALSGIVDDPKQTAHRLLRIFGGKALSGVRDVSLLMDAAQLSEEAAKHVISILALGERLFHPRQQQSVEIHGPEDAYRYLSPQLHELTREYFRGLYLNVKGTLIADEIISIGTLTASLVHPREVFGPALEGRCHTVLIAHNHPSGDPNPSAEDIHITRELAEAGRLLGIELLDHIIIGQDSYVSLKERGIF
ncbi:MAG: DNA repair protein RadC [bacterium]